MLPARLNAVNEALLRELVSHACPESQNLDFKRDLPGRDEKSRAEFLKDVCAFANADGGDLIFGIRDADGCAAELMPITSDAADATKRRLGQILDAGLEPRVAGLQMEDVSISGSGYVLVLRVPPSFDGPHWYSEGGVRKFVLRSGTHTADMTYEQLRNAFDRTGSAIERTRRFRHERLAAIQRGKTWAPIRPGPLCVLHVVPLASMTGRRSIDVQRVFYEYQPFYFRDWDGVSRTLNLDGVVVHTGRVGAEPVLEYTQIFRSGAVEALRYGGRTVDEEKIIPGMTIALFFRDAVVQFLPAIQNFGYTGPAVIGCALLSIGDYVFGGGIAYSRETVVPDRSDLVLPDIWVDRLEAPGEVDDIVRPMLDVLWQCFGVARCPHYDQGGRWVDKHTFPR